VKRRVSRRRRWWIGGAATALALVAAVVVLHRFVFETFYVPSASMAPTLQAGDRIVVDTLSYDLRGVRRGDVIVFRPPPRETADRRVDLVKRVVGLPGEVISSRRGTVDIDGRPLSEPWLPRDDPTAAFGPVTIPKGEYFVMGDNRRASYDSRDWGPVPASYIVGPVVFRVWPPARLGGL
jgi:signal peptidase I